MTYRTFIFLSLCLSLFGCHKFETLDDLELPPHKAKLVVFANLKNTGRSNYQTVYIGKTRNALDSAKAFVIKDSFYRDSTWYRFSEYGIDTVNATVELFRNGKLLSTLNRGLRGDFNEYWFSEKIETDGATYKLRVSAAGFETVEGEQVMPNVVKLDSVKFLRKGLVIRGIYYFPNAYEFFFFFKDSASSMPNFYTTFAALPFNFQLKNLDLTVNGNVLSDVGFNGRNMIWKVFYDNVINNEPKSGTFGLQSINLDAYLFEQSSKLYFETRNNQFAEPTTLYSNIKNGYGIFTLSAVSEFYLQF
jgi:hypothetical protein